jgi:hypothetical protein
VAFSRGTEEDHGNSLKAANVWVKPWVRDFPNTNMVANYRNVESIITSVFFIS